MSNNRVKTLWAGAVAGLAMLGFQQQANAVTVEIKACQGAVCVTSVQGIGATALLNATVGDYRVTVSGGSSFESGLVSNINNSSTGVSRLTGNSADALIVYVTAFGYLLPDDTEYLLDSTHGATAGVGFTPSPVDFQAYVDFTNALYGTQNTNGQISCAPSLAAGTPASCSVNGTAALLTGGATPFSMTTLTRFNILQTDLNSQWTSNSQAEIVVPEPASLALLGLGLLGVGLARRRRVA